MDRIKLDKLITENMKAIFGFALTRLSNVQKAEELSSDIIYQIMKSADNLKKEDSFYAFMWKIAENTYKTYLRKSVRPVNNFIELNENSLGESESLIDEIVNREEINLLKRELSLLSSNYRKATVLFYIEEYSCSEIAKILNISVEMVKYYLFRARKIIREGMKMDRLFGEKSYNPTIFEIDFWGTKAGDDKEYNDFKNRKIKGNILLAAYYTPITIQELSIELGVAVTYLEDEIRLLVERQYLVCNNDRYITNIPIFTCECEKAIQNKIESITAKAALELLTIEDEFTAKYGCKFENENQIRWNKILLALHYALARREETTGKLPENGPYSLVNGGGGRGVVWGRCIDNTPKNDSEQIGGIYNGCLSKDKRGSVIAMNFGQIKDNQLFSWNFTDPIVATAVDCFEYLPDEWKKTLETYGFVESGKANFPVYSYKEYEDIEKILEKSIIVLYNLGESVTKIAAEIMADFAPIHIKEYAEYVGAFIHSLDIAQNVVNELYNKEYLKPMENSFKSAMCVVKSGDQK